MRLPMPAAVFGAALIVLGGAGLVRAAVPMPVPGVHHAADTDPIVVSNAYVRPPAPPSRSAAAYFTVYNTTGRADRLVSVQTGAGASAVLHTAHMRADRRGLVIPAHGKVVLSTGHGHVMIEHVYGTLRPGQSVDIELSFARAGIVAVNATVIALGAPAPTGG